MLKYLIILLSWIVPGILLFLYLMWISKKFAPTLEQAEAPATAPATSRARAAD